ncbi:MAG: hypothetical protein ACU837_02660 [Gammaproteobacteria bacterium]
MKIRFLQVCAALSVFALSACATTTLTHVWKDPQWVPGTIKTMLVVGIAGEPAKRRLFEDEFAKQLRAHHINVVKSYDVISLEELNDKKGAIEKFRDIGVDAVLATRLVDKQTIDTYYPPTYSYAPAGAYLGWGDYYGLGYSFMASPGYYVSEDLVKLETNIYEAKNEKLIWSALSDTWLDRASQDSVIADFIEVLTKRLTKDGVIPKIEK